VPQTKTAYRWMASGLALAALAAAAPAWAEFDRIQLNPLDGNLTAKIDNPSGSMTLIAGGQTQSFSVLGSNQIYSPGGETSVGNYVSGSAGSVNVNVKSTSSSEAFGSGSVTYYLFVVGPDSFPIYLNLVGQIKLSAFVAPGNVDIGSGDFTSSSGALSVTGVKTNLVQTWNCSGVSKSCPNQQFSLYPTVNSISRSMLEDAAAGGDVDLTPYEVKIKLNAVALAQMNGDSAYADIDPMFTVLPIGGVEPSDYDIYLSTGFANAIGSPTPEPAGWALMLGGVALVGMSLRARRRGSPAPTAA